MSRVFILTSSQKLIGGLAAGCEEGERQTTPRQGDRKGSPLLGTEVVYRVGARLALALGWRGPIYEWIPVFISSSLSFRSTAPSSSRTCSTEVALAIAAVIPGRAIIQASATCDTVTWRAAAMRSSSSSTLKPFSFM